MINQNQILGIIETDGNLLQDISYLVNKVREMEMDHIKMQFKYDIALNLVKNYCSDYFVDTLQDSSNGEVFLNLSYVSITESIK